jgi:hypothetical protein
MNRNLTGNIYGNTCIKSAQFIPDININVINPSCITLKATYSYKSILYYPDVPITCIILTSTNIYKPYLDYPDINLKY